MYVVYKYSENKNIFTFITFIINLERLRVYDWRAVPLPANIEL